MTTEHNGGCACRWDADDNRVATCARHQGWLDVVREWAERAKASEEVGVTLLAALIDERRVRLLGMEPDVHWESMRDLRRSSAAATDAAIAKATGVQS